MSLELRKHLFERIAATEPTVMLAANYDIALRVANCILSSNLEYLQKNGQTVKKFPKNGNCRV